MWPTRQKELPTSALNPLHGPLEVHGSRLRTQGQLEIVVKSHTKFKNIFFFLLVKLGLLLFPFYLTSFDQIVDFVTKTIICQNKYTESIRTLFAMKKASSQFKL